MSMISKLDKDVRTLAEMMMMKTVKAIGQRTNPSFINFENSKFINILLRVCPIALRLEA